MQAFRNKFVENGPMTSSAACLPPLFDDVETQVSGFHLVVCVANIYMGFCAVCDDCVALLDMFIPVNALWRTR